MHLHDPTRPRIGNQPALLSGRSIVPHLCLDLRPSGQVYVSAMLPIAGESGSAWFGREFRLDALEDFLQQMLSDPELTLRELSSPSGFRAALDQGESTIRDPAPRPEPSHRHPQLPTPGRRSIEDLL